MTKSQSRSGNSGADKFRRLTRQELGGFDDQARKLILEAIEYGCLGDISANGNCIIRNNAGGSVSVSRNKGASNRKIHNVRRDLRHLMSNHSHDDGAAITRQTSRTPELMTVAEAFVVHGAAFSRWFDRQPESLPATQQLEVTFDEDGVVRFSVREGNGGADTRAPRFEPAATGRHDADTSAVIGPGQGLPAGAEPPTSIVAGALPDDAELARLTARVTALGAELAREKRRADEAQARLDLVREVLDV